MGNTVSPALVTLGAAIRRHREAAGLKQAQLATTLNYSDGWVSNVETGQLRPRRQAVMACESALGLPDGVLLDIYGLIKEDTPHPVGSFERFADAERRAIVIREYDALVVPGLLQTPDYALALIAAGRPAATPEVIESLLSAGSSGRRTCRATTVRRCGWSWTKPCSGGPSAGAKCTSHNSTPCGGSAASGHRGSGDPPGNRSARGADVQLSHL